MSYKVIIKCPKCGFSSEISALIRIPVGIEVAGEDHTREAGISEGQVLDCHPLECDFLFQDDDPTHCDACGYHGHMYDFIEERIIN